MFRTDRSNRDPSFVRNRIRLRLIPYLERNYNPSVRDAILRCCGILREQQAFIEAEAEALFRRTARRAGGAIRLPVRAVAAAPRALASELVRTAAREAGGSAPSLSETEAVLRMCVAGEGKQRIRLLAGCAVAREYESLLFDPSPEGLVEPYELPLVDGLVTDSTPFPLRFSLRVREAAGVRRPRPARRQSLAEVWSGGPDGFAPLVERLSWDRMEGRRLAVRNRRPGDRYRPVGMKGRKKIKDVMIDEKLPRRLRGAVPLVTCDGKPVWLVGYRIAHAFRVVATTRRIVELRVEKAPVSRGT